MAQRRVGLAIRLEFGRRPLDRSNLPVLVPLQRALASQGSSVVAVEEPPILVQKLAQQVFLPPAAQWGANFLVVVAPVRPAILLVERVVALVLVVAIDRLARDLFVELGRQIAMDRLQLARKLPLAQIRASIHLAQARSKDLERRRKYPQQARQVFRVVQKRLVAQTDCRLVKLEMTPPPDRTAGLLLPPGQRDSLLEETVESLAHRAEHRKRAVVRWPLAFHYWLVPGMVAQKG